MTLLRDLLVLLHLSRFCCVVFVRVRNISVISEAFPVCFLFLTFLHDPLYLNAHPHGSLCLGLCRHDGTDWQFICFGFGRSQMLLSMGQYIWLQRSKYLGGAVGQKHKLLRLFLRTCIYQSDINAQSQSAVWSCFSHLPTIFSDASFECQVSYLS